MAAYSSFAEIYDSLMDDFDYPAWAALYHELLCERGAPPKTVCECACGTGSLTIPLAEYGLRMTGVDLSEEMLRLAADKARAAGAQLRLVHQDMCALSLPRPVDAVLCTCDGLNYLTDLTRVRRFFAAAARSIRPGGTLAFDISSKYKLETVLGNGFFGEERDEVAYLWSNKWDPDRHTVTMDLTFFVRESGGLYRRFSEQHVQRAHTPEELLPLLEAEGFTDIHIYGEKAPTPPQENELRLHITARRA